MNYRSLAHGLLGLMVMAAAVSADIVTTNLYYDDSSGPNSGGQLNVSSFDYLDSLVDPTTGVTFDIVMTITPSGGNLDTNGGTNDREWGVNGASDPNNALDTVGESITASLTSLTVTSYGDFAPRDVSVSFDGFTDVIAYFVENDGDSGQFTDGSDVLFEWNGSLAGGSPDASGVPFDYGVSGQGASNTNVARLDLTSVMPTTLVAEFTEFTGSGSPVEENRWRVDDFGLQFTVDVVEPDPLMLRVEPDQMYLLGGSAETGRNLGISYLELRSDSGSLDPTGYAGLAGSPDFPAGNDDGAGWEVADNSSSEFIIESYLLGSSTIAVEEAVGLGDGFADGGAEDVTFTYLLADGPTVYSGLVEYVLPGDFNDDGAVDAGDYTVWRDNLGGDESVLAGNGDGSGVVDTGDYLEWKEHYGLSWGAAAVTAVPEPMGLLAWVVASVGFAGVGRRR